MFGIVMSTAFIIHSEYTINYPKFKKSCLFNSIFPIGDIVKVSYNRLLLFFLHPNLLRPNPTNPYTPIVEILSTHTSHPSIFFFIVPPPLVHKKSSLHFRRWVL